MTARPFFQSYTKMLKNIFSLPIYSTKTSDSEFKLISEEIYNNVDFSTLRLENPEAWVDDIKSTFGNGHLLKDYRLGELSSFISRHVVNFVNEVELEELNMNIDDCWINISNKSDGQEIHNHTVAYLSGVFYLKTLSRGGRIFFYNPNLGATLFPRNARDKNVNSYHWEFTPVEGQLILFPGYLNHSVETNKTEEERVSIAFNVNVA